MGKVFEKLVYRMEDLETPAHHPGPARKRPEKNLQLTPLANLYTQCKQEEKAKEEF